MRAWVIAILLLAPLAIAATPPSAPRSPGAVQGANPGEIDVNWTVPASAGSSPISGYNVYGSLSPPGRSLFAALGSGSFVWTDTGILDPAPRTYWISAVSAAGEGPLSAAVTAYPLTPPGPPRNATAGPSGRGIITFNWSAPELNGTIDIMGYNVYRGATPTGPFSLHASAASGPITDTGLADNTTFYYYATAVNAVGEGNASDVVNGTSARAPDAPVNLTAGFFPGTGVVVAWQTPYDGGLPIMYYAVWRAIDSGPEQFLALEGSNAGAFHDTHCPLLSTCHYRVAAQNAVGRGAKAGPVQSLGDAPLAII